MNNDKGYFETPEFRALLRKYEQMKQENSGLYFETDQLTDILSYYLFHEKTQEVEEVYTLAKRLHPGSPEITKMEIRMLLSYDRPEAALPLLDKLQYAEDEDTLLLKAEAYLALKDYKTARKIAREILRRSTITDEASYEALEILLDCGFAQDVLSTVNEGLLRHPDSRNLLEVKAESLIELQRTDEAIEIYNRLLDEEPYSTFYWEQLGHIYFMIRRFGKALECFEYESTIDDKIEYAKMMQAYCYHHLHDYEKSSKLFASLGDKYPKSIIPDFYKALAAAYSGNTSAINDFKRVAAKGMAKGASNIETMLALLNVAMLYYKTGETDTAIIYLKEAIQYKPSCDSLKQIIANNSMLYELRDKENMTFPDINVSETKEWYEYEIMFELSKQLINKNFPLLALYTLHIARATAPDTAEIDAYIAYVLYRCDNKSEDFRRVISSALDGRSDSLFKLFNVPYSTDIMPEDFISRINVD